MDLFKKIENNFIRLFFSNLTLTFKKNFSSSRSLYLLILLPQFIFGLDDFDSWSSVSFNKKFPYSFSISFKQGLRLKEQFSTLKQTHSEVSIAYKLLDNLKIEIPYRYTLYKNKVKQRLSLSGFQKYKIMPFSLKHRVKYQWTFEEEELSERLIRNKFYFLYKFKKWVEPFISGEIFHFHQNEKYKFDELRLSLGLGIDFSKKQSLKISYTLKSEDLSKDNPDLINIFLIAYSFRL